MSEWNDWLRELRAAGKGPARIDAARHTAFAATVTLDADYTGATLRGQVRASPDAVGPALASFTVSAPSVAEGATTFDLSLPKGTVQALPSDVDANGRTTLVYDLLLTPNGGTEELLFGGEFVVIGGVTQ